MKLQMHAKTTYPARKRSNFKEMCEAVSARGFSVRAAWPVLYINNTCYEWPDGLARMREIIFMYARSEMDA